MLSAYIWMAAGGALGTMARFWLALTMAQLVGDRFPWGTLLINVLGSFVIGLFATLTLPGARLDVPSDIKLFVLVGLCGGFTTFSSFSLQTLELLRAGEVFAGIAYAAGSVLLCLLGVALGALLGRV
jgi:CrcB protein